MKKLSFKIYNHTDTLPNNWDTVAYRNVFLQKKYLEVLEKSAPVNMQCFYIAIYEDVELIGVSLAQYLDLNKLESFGERDKCFKTWIRNIIFRNFGSHTLFLGNNMITGQNGYTFSKEIDFEALSSILMESAREITQYFKHQNIKIHLVSFKDFYEDCAKELKKNSFSSLFEYSSQPNMVLYVAPLWQDRNDYINAFSKKYRDQYKRARKKCSEVQVKELTHEEIIEHETTLYDLYHYVAKNAPFNTFFLAKNHFSTLKNQCLDHFKLYGYLLEGKLVGFHTILLNDKVLETYFLGYDPQVQKENMLYLNMLYNMAEFGIENKFERIIFGRTALEIKSSIGAIPVTMSGFIYHNTRWINKYLDRFFKKLEPNIEWQRRHPFK
ncbi:GNAT family N-acetyltransferase [Flavobacterium aciduliphilum]|uniref:Acetyltransferase (GNAT) family protein n=1 Tax=Flavobacterium aciduliphilum TaxID=1101402 RepID=A0A328YHU9_9FLAO|nr:GNAT family N-acetyltransferase [Flavobacterium aciduliphilum]RAR71572.1 acetyltransferase (GNAT) family protein [Flavobacterium aciduliphilum]